MITGRGTTRRELVEAAARRLSDAAGDARENPRREASLLLQSAIGVDRSHLLAHGDRPVALGDASRFWDMVGARSRGMPLPLIVGETGFHEVSLAVEPGVFVPRPETELLVEEGRRAVRDALPAARAAGGLAAGRRVTVLDLGTGTGAIAIAVAAAHRTRPEVAVFAGDWNPRAVRLARRNVERNDLNGRVEVRRSELFSAFADLEGRVDVLLSNPPYIAPAEAESLPLEVRLGDPDDALYDPAGGTGFHRRIAKRGLDFLADGGTLVMEMGETQGGELLELVEGLGYLDSRVLRDLAGRDRFVRGVRPER